jgi:hypothetical protein
MLELPKEDGTSNFKSLDKIDLTKIHVKWIVSADIKKNIVK